MHQRSKAKTSAIFGAVYLPCKQAKQIWQTLALALGNPWLCDDALKPILANIRTLYSSSAEASKPFYLGNADETTCLLPKSLRGKKLLELHPAELKPYDPSIDVETTTSILTTTITTTTTAPARITDRAPVKTEQPPAAPGSENGKAAKVGEGSEEKGTESEEISRATLGIAIGVIIAVLFTILIIIVVVMIIRKRREQEKWGGEAELSHK